MISGMKTEGERGSIWRKVCSSATLSTIDCPGIKTNHCGEKPVTVV